MGASYLLTLSVDPQALTEPDKQISHIRLFTPFRTLLELSYLCSFCFHRLSSIEEGQCFLCTNLVCEELRSIGITRLLAIPFFITLSECLLCLSFWSITHTQKFGLPFKSILTSLVALHSFCMLDTVFDPGARRQTRLYACRLIVCST